MSEMTEARKQYLADYRKEHLRRVNLDVSPEMYEGIKRAAEKKEMPVNTMLKWLIRQYLTHEELM